MRKASSLKDQLSTMYILCLYKSKKKCVFFVPCILLFSRRFASVRALGRTRKNRRPMDLLAPVRERVGLTAAATRQVHTRHDDSFEMHVRRQQETNEIEPDEKAGRQRAANSFFTHRRYSTALKFVEPVALDEPLNAIGSYSMIIFEIAQTITRKCSYTVL
ncbi:hypothetical protein EVAR_79136_1 [Eumeta japonica]|uniref:Uncharacterized protein n=1 Tax=Eumeta variegata TaxID=151549 RepID=A0A4C1UU85_EUMVA|nr:hypothetical protein EVAR_79136_1 [Eumeta japonica]